MRVRIASRSVNERYRATRPGRRSSDSTSSGRGGFAQRGGAIISTRNPHAHCRTLMTLIPSPAQLRQRRADEEHAGAADKCSFWRADDGDQAMIATIAEGSHLLRLWIMDDGLVAEREQPFARPQLDDRMADDALRVGVLG